MRNNIGIAEDRISHHSNQSSLDLDEEDRRYLEALRDENHVVTKTTRHPLGLFSVVAFILQQMIGTGIFRTPWTMIHATDSIGVTLIFWFIGALTAVAGAILYIEFGLALPRHLIDGKVEPVVRNGGDLNYVSYLIKRPKFLIVCFYGLNYIILASSAANSLSFGDTVIGGGVDRSAAKDAAARVVAIAAVTVACLLHSFTRRGGILLNNIMVIAKLMILTVFPIMAICALAGVSDTNYAAENMKPSNAFAGAHSNVDGYVQGTLAILFAYNGYNQANYVLCEINQPRKTLPKGIIIATGTACVLYMLVNLSYMIVVSKEQQLSTPDIALQFLINMIGDKYASKILALFTSITSFGNIIGMTFAASRVKQEIAKEGVIPFAKFFGENRALFTRGKRTSTNPDGDAEPTPYGALLLHWIFAILLILLTWPAKPVYGYRILVNLYTYTTDVIPSFIMGVGMLSLRFFTNWSSKSPIPPYLSIISAIIFTISNGFPLVAIWIPPMGKESEMIRNIIPNFPWWMTGTLSWVLVLCSVIYWAVFRFVWPRFGRRKGKEFVVEREPVFRMQGGERVEWHEIVLHSWVVKSEPGRRNGRERGSYVMDDI